MAKLTEVRTDSKQYRIIQCATIIQNRRLWSNDAVHSAQTELYALDRDEPTLEELAARYGQKIVDAVIEDVLQVRLTEIDEQRERMGHGAPCHLCGALRGPPERYFSFGLAKILENTIEWGEAGAALAWNLLTLPLGFVVGAIPGSSTRMQVARCRLMLCEACHKQHTGFFGRSKIRAHHCEHHPSWQKLRQKGYTRYMSPKALDGLG